MKNLSIIGIDDLALSIVFVQTLISAAVILITAEFLPKSSISKIRKFFIAIFAIPTVLFYHVLSPLTNSFLWFPMSFDRFYDK